MFNENTLGNYKPRAVLCDLDDDTIPSILKNDNLSLFDAENAIYTNETSGGLYTKANRSADRSIEESVLS